MNYTKGEWKVDTEGSLLISVLSQDTVIAICGKPKWITSRDTQLANAHLISAAPDCYEQLKEADAVICDLCKRLNPQHENCDYCQDREPRLNAIAKAEGK